MIRKVLYIVVLLSLFLCFQANAATYFVKNGGSDGEDGLSDANAWVTIAKVNGFTFSTGDTVQFKRGSTFNDATLGTPGVNDFTFQDYDSGAKPLIDGDVIRPININDTITNLTIKNIDISGQGWQVAKSPNLNVTNVTGNVTIDGVIGNGHKGSNYDGKNAVTIVNCSGTITVQNCTLYNWGPQDIGNSAQDSTDYIGIVLDEIDTGTIDINNNTVYNCNSDCILIWRSEAGGIVHDNTFYNAGEDCFDLKGSDGLDVYDNTMYREVGFTNQLGGTATFMLVHEASEEAGSKAEDNIIRDNTFHSGTNGGNAIAILIAVESYRTTIYNNYIEDTEGSLVIDNFTRDTLAYNNIIVNPRTFTYGSREAGGIYENNAYTQTEIYNNTIYNATGSCLKPFNIEFCEGTLIKNNIVYHDSAGATDYCFDFSGNGSVDPVVEYNLWYNPSHINRIEWKGVVYDNTEQTAWRDLSPGHPGEILNSDPLLVSATNQHLQGTSPVIDVGVDLSGTFTTDYDDKTRPHGSGHDMGALEYYSTVIPPLIMP